MDIEHIREFTTLAKTLNFTKTASQLNISQPVLSKHIADLERMIHAKLFLRDRSPIELTPIGEVFLRESQKTLLQYDESVRKVRMLRNATSSSITITSHQAFKPMDDLIHATRLSLKESHPLMKVSVSRYKTKGPLQLIENHESDICLEAVLEKSFEGLNARLIFREPLMAVVSRFSSLASKDALKTEDLTKHIVMYSAAEPVYDHYRVIQKLLLNHGAKPSFIERPYFGAPDLFELNFENEIYVDGAGVILHSLPLISLKRDYSVIPFEGEKLNLKHYAIWNREGSDPACEDFVDALQATAKSVDMSEYWR